MDAQLDEFVPEGLRIVPGVNGNLFLQKDRARIHAFIQPEKRDPALGLSVNQRPLHGRRSAILRKKRKVNVEKPMTGDRKDLFGQELPVSNDNPQVRPKRSHLFGRRGVLQCRRLPEGKFQPFGGNLDLGRMELVAAPRRLVRRGDDGSQLSLASGQFQEWNRQGGCSQKNALQHGRIRTGRIFGGARFPA